jgi:RimJ/RimL family protein N-acetyltransferase
MKAENVYLRSIEPEDYLASHRWRNDHHLMRAVFERARFVSRETERKWVLRAIEENESGKAVRLAICMKQDDQLIGYTYLLGIDRENRSCETALLIGERAHQGRGLAAEAGYLTLQHAFLDLDMNRVFARLQTDQLAVIKIAEQLGATKEGVLRQAIRKGGQYHDVIIYSFLREDFLAKYT